MSKSIIKQKRILTKASGGSSLATPVSVANGGTGISSYAIGDIIYASGATTLSKLPIGTASQQLRVNAGATALEYFTPASSGITVGSTTITSGADNRILFQDATANDYVTQIANFTMGSVASGWLDVPSGYALGGTKFITGGTTNNSLGIKIGGAETQTATSVNSVFIGNQIGNSSTGARQIVLGYYSQSWGSSTDVIALSNAGVGASGLSSVLLIGASSTVWGSDVVSYDAVIGSSTGYRQFYFGEGKTKVSPFGVTFNATGGSGTNNAGASLTLAGGKGTGNATTGGDIIFQTSDVGASGATLQTLTTKFTIKKSGSIEVTKSIDTTSGDSATIDKVAGRFRKDNSGTTFTLTNALITANSIILLTPIQVDLTAISWGVVAGAGSCVITFNAAPTADFDMNFLVIN